MKKEKSYIVCFSPTGTSKKGAISIGEEVSYSVELVDLTIKGTVPKKSEFLKDDIVVFGAPVYGGRLYKEVYTRFSQLKGNNTPCIITVTYGNRDYDDALLEMKDFVSELGFVPIAAAALIGQHTFGEIQVGRPNEADVSEDKQFAEKALQKLNSLDMSVVEVPGNHPYKDGGLGGGFRPLTNENCIECGLCAKECPEQAIDYENFSIIDNDKCISCFRCIRICPVQAKNMDTEAYNNFAVDFTKRLCAKRENEYII